MIGNVTDKFREMNASAYIKCTPLDVEKQLAMKEEAICSINMSISLLLFVH